MVCFIDLEGTPLSDLDLLIVNFAIKSGYEIDSHEKLTSFIQQGQGCLLHPKLIGSLKFKPKGSNRALSLQDLINTDPFIKGIKAALTESPGNPVPNPFEAGDNIVLDALNLQYELGYITGQCYKNDFKKQKERLYIRELARHLREGDESDHWN